MTKIEIFQWLRPKWKVFKRNLTKFEMFRNTSKIHIKSRFFHIMTVIQILRLLLLISRFFENFDWNWKWLILLTEIEIFGRFWIENFDWSEDFFTFFGKFKKKTGTFSKIMTVILIFSNFFSAVVIFRLFWLKPRFLGKFWQRSRFFDEFWKKRVFSRIYIKSRFIGHYDCNRNF